MAGDGHRNFAVRGRDSRLGALWKFYILSFQELIEKELYVFLPASPICSAISARRSTAPFRGWGGTWCRSPVHARERAVGASDVEHGSFDKFGVRLRGYGGEPSLPPRRARRACRRRRTCACCGRRPSPRNTVQQALTLSSKEACIHTMFALPTPKRPTFTFSGSSDSAEESAKCDSAVHS